MSDFSHKEQKFRTGIGVDATIERGRMGSERAAPHNRMLADLGLALQASDDYLKHFDYKGSAAVHVYVNEIVSQLTFVCQTDPLVIWRCPEILAKKAFDDMLASMKETYGHNRPKLRSGF